MQAVHFDASSTAVGNDVVWTDGVSVSTLADPYAVPCITQPDRARCIRADQVAGDRVGGSARCRQDNTIA